MLARFLWGIFVVGAGMMIWFGRREFSYDFLAGAIVAFGVILCMIHAFFKPPP